MKIKCSCTHRHTHTYIHTHRGMNFSGVKVLQTVNETSFIPNWHEHFRFGTLSKVKLFCIVCSKLFPLQISWFTIYWHANFQLYMHTHALPQRHTHTYIHIHPHTHTHTQKWHIHIKFFTAGVEVSKFFWFLM